MNKKNLLLLLVLFIAANSFAIAQDGKIKFRKEKLSNGLTVIYHVDNSAPVVATVLHYKVGSKDEMSDRTGFAHFFEHLMFEATDDIPRDQIDKFVNEAGGSLNAHTSFDETVYQFRMPSNQLQLALWIESSRMRRLQVAEIGVETQRGVVKEERRVRYDNTPYGDAFERMFKNLYKGSYYEWMPIGSLEHLNKASIAEFQKFYTNFYQPNNGVLVISGDFSIAEASEWVKAYFEQYPKGPEPVRNTSKIPAFTGGEYREKVEDSKATVPALMMAWRAPSKADKDAYAAELLGEILSAGRSSRLYRRVVEEEKLATSISLGATIMEKAGAFSLRAIPTEGTKLEDIEEEVEDIIEEIAKKGISDEELTKVKNIAAADIVESNDGVLQKGMKLAAFEAYYGQPERINDEMKNYEAVTKKDIQEAAKKYLETKNRVVLHYVPKKAQ